MPDSFETRLGVYGERLSTVQQQVAELRAQRKEDYAHFTKEFEDRDAELSKADKERLRGRRSLWLALATLMIAFGGLIITLLQLTSS